MSLVGFKPPPQGPTYKAKAANAVWSPVKTEPDVSMPKETKETNQLKYQDESSPVWQPFGAFPEDKPQFRTVKLEIEKNKNDQEVLVKSEEITNRMTQKIESQNANNNITNPSNQVSPRCLTGLSNKLPQSQSPTVTLLQKAREGQIPKGALYIKVNEEENVSGQNVPIKYEGIGPTVQGIPLSLRTEIKEEYASDWYKTMYKSLHKFDNPPDDYFTVKYFKKGNVPHADGYMSEPEIGKDYTVKYSKNKYAKTLEIINGNNEIESKNIYLPTSLHSNQEIYKNQPRSITEYEPGHSSISDREERIQKSKYLPPLNQPKPSYIYRDGYESDSTLFRRTGKPSSLDPLQQKLWYRKIQQGSDIPFSGLGKPAPERPKISPHKYQETEVNIHYRSPIHNLEKEYIEEEELRKRQEEAMKKFYEEEKYKKYLQQLAEIEMRRHNDFFIPSQKSPIPLNRYDNPFELTTSPPKTLETRTMARVLFNFTAQTSRELSLDKGNVVYILRKIDENWYEGEYHGMIGIFPVNYVEIIPQENANLQPRRVTEGLAKVKFNFRAKTPLELSLFKGEKVVLMRQVDSNWYEGRIGNKKGIFPLSYIEIIKEPGEIVASSMSPKPASKSVFDTFVNRIPTSQQENFSPNDSYLEDFKLNSTNKQFIQEKTQPLTQSLHIDTTNEPIPYRVLYNYKPQNEDELELQEQDTVYVLEKCDDGWYVGTSLRTGLFGTFPGNYVERI